MLSEKKLLVSIGSLQKKLCMNVYTVYTQIQKIRKYLYGHFWVLGDMCFFFLHFSLSDFSIQETYVLLI